MTYNELKDAIESVQHAVSDDACNVLDYILDRYSDEDEDIDEYDVYDAIIEECDSYLIYYSDAWEYLSSNNITDFDEAIAEGNKDVCSIACYYLTQEINDNLRL